MSQTQQTHCVKSEKTVITTKECCEENMCGPSLFTLRLIDRLHIWLQSADKIYKGDQLVANVAS